MGTPRIFTRFQYDVANSKVFQVPLSYFEEGGENIEPSIPYETAPAGEVNNIIGMCTECGKMLTEEEIYTATPKIICRTCAARMQREEEERRQAEEEQRRTAEAQAKAIIEREESYRRAKNKAALREELGGGVDLKLIISLALALAAYIALTVSCFAHAEDRDLIAMLLMLVPLAAFACPYVIFDFIDDLRDKDNPYDGYNLILSLIVGAGFAVTNIVLFLIIYLNLDSNGYYLGLLGIGAVVSFTFISQYMWGNAIPAIFTCGGFTFKLPGIIFALDVESILFMIIIKIVLGIIAVLVFLATTVLCALVAIFGSALTFIPSLAVKLIKDAKIRREYRD